MRCYKMIRHTRAEGVREEVSLVYCGLFTELEADSLACRHVMGGSLSDMVSLPILQFT